MRLLLAAIISLTFISCSAVSTKTITYSEHELMMRDYIFNQVVTKKTQENKFKIHLEPLRPQPDDFKIYEIDLNHDGKMDFLASIENFMFNEKGTYPLYIMIADDFGGYTPLPDAPRIDFFDVSVFSESDIPFPDLIIACKTYHYNGFTYKEIQE